MEMPKVKLLSYYDVKYGADMPSSLFVTTKEHEEVLMWFRSVLLATQDELIKAYNEIIALKSNIPYQVVQKEPVAQFDGCWVVKVGRADPKVMLNKPDAQFLMDKLGIYYPHACKLIDTGICTTADNVDIKLWKLEAL